MSEEEEIELDPEPGILIESLRDVGYSFNSAVADIIDNSITANSGNVSVFALPFGDGGFKFAIVDDGDGLDRGELLKAMRLGSSNPRLARAAGDLGRFGLGLKTASFSQCRRLTVVSRRDGDTSAFTWDLDTVVRSNKWTVIERQDVSNLFGVDALGEHGTLVLWEKVDRLTGENGAGRVDYERVISEAQDHLALVFHRFLGNKPGTPHITLQVNGRVVEPLDPFNVENPATRADSEELVCPGVRLRSYTLPHVSKYADKQEYERYGLPGGYLRNQGVYLYRAKRLIIHGTWFGLAKKTALTQLTRVRIDIDTDQDEVWKIDVKKTSAQMPEAVRKRVKQLIEVIGAPSRRVYRRRTANLTSRESYPVWNRSEKDEHVVYSINEEHPVLAAFRNELDDGQAKKFDSLMAFIGSMLPMEALVYDISNNSDNTSTEKMCSEDFADTVRTFFARMRQTSDDEEVLDIMHAVEPFKSRWSETVTALGIEER